MSLDLSTFDPKSAGELASAIEGEISSMGKDWWKANSSAVKGYLKSLADAATETAKSVVAGTMPEEEAKQILQMQKDAFETSIKFGEFMTLALAQNVVDEVGKILQAAIKNKTGITINL